MQAQRKSSLQRLALGIGLAALAGLLLGMNMALFPGMDPMDPLTARQLNRAVHDAAAAAGIAKRVTTHTLRHSFATHLLERKVDIRVIQVLLGHKKLETTSIYAHVATDLLREVIGPLEEMPPKS